MYKYEYEKVYSHLGGFGLLNGNVYKIEEYKEIINKRATEGWRYIGFMPVEQRGTGHIEVLELIFEKMINDKESKS